MGDAAHTFTIPEGCHWNDLRNVSENVGKAIADALTAGAPYLEFSDKRDGMLYTTEMSRRAYGVVLWSIVKSLGADGIAKMVDDMCDNTQYFGEELEKAGITVVLPPSFNQLMIKFGSDEETNAVLAAIRRTKQMEGRGRHQDQRLVLQHDERRCRYSRRSHKEDRRRYL